MLKKLTRSKFVASLMAVCFIFAAMTTPVFAAEPDPSNEVEEYTLVFDESGELIAVPSSVASGYTTFVTFTSGTYSVPQSYTFSLGHACKLKMMWGGRYTDGTSGTLTATLEGPTTWQEHDFAMDGTARAIEFSGNWFTGTLPAGNYSIYLDPDTYKSYVSAGSVYSLSY